MLYNWFEFDTKNGSSLLPEPPAKSTELEKENKDTAIKIPINKNFLLNI